MSDYVTAIGLDVHARSISACAFDPMTGEVTRARFGYDPASVAEWVPGFESPKAVYESGPTGFHLCRALRALEAAARPEWAPVVDALCLVKGIDVATAFLLAAEAGDFSRFPTVPSFASWCGPAPSERSSGETESRGGITRAGNGHVRRALVEASRHVPMSTRHPKKPRPCHGVAPAVSRHAAKCNRRLQDRRGAMSQAGKRPCVANCATAREMACWVWAIALMAR